MSSWLVTHVCVTQRRVPAPIERVVRSLIDWEGDEAYLVQLANMQTNEPMDFYSIVWAQTKVEEQSNGSHNRLPNRLFSGPQWDIFDNP